MTRPLPPLPNLRQFKIQAKDLLKAHKNGDAEVLIRIRQHLPRCAEFSDEDIRDGELFLQEAQHIIACEYGFRHWEMLLAVVEADLSLLAQLRDQDIQEILRAVDQKDFISAFRTSDALVLERFMSNISQRVRTFINEEIEATDEPPAEEILAMRQRIMELGARFAVQGKITWPNQS